MKKVMVFGSFDILHPGHLDFFKQAKRYGDYLVVVVARDLTIKKLKGKLPSFNEKRRLAKIEVTGIADKVIPGKLKDYYKVIKEQKPAIICLGYDQKYFVADLKKKFQDLKIVRLKSYKPEIYKSSKIRNK